jgi:two-component system, LuxR family, sensor kinase FixL
VLLNLVPNATDAIQDLPADRRKVVVRAARDRNGQVELAVSGLGIGLSISRTIIEAHGGRIGAENNAQEGATFRFTLPLAGQAAPS